MIAFMLHCEHSRLLLFFVLTQRKVNKRKVKANPIPPGVLPCLPAQNALSSRAFGIAAQALRHRAVFTPGLHVLSSRRLPTSITKASTLNKQHVVWKLSFDWKDCRSKDFVWQKLDQMHNNLT